MSVSATATALDVQLLHLEEERSCGRDEKTVANFRRKPCQMENSFAFETSAMAKVVRIASASRHLPLVCRHRNESGCFFICTGILNRQAAFWEVQERLGYVIHHLS